MTFQTLCKRLWKKSCRIINRLKQFTRGIQYKNEIEILLEEIEEKQLPVIIFLDIVDWDIPLFQRPQHMAKCLAKEGYTYLFFTTNTYDDINSFKQQDNNLYIINNVFKKKIIDTIQLRHKYIQLYSTDMKTTVADIEKYKKLGYKLIYEYIDEIAPELYGSDIPQIALKKHTYILKDEEIFMVCTARKLYQETIAIRELNRVQLITNGVEYNHFSEQRDKVVKTKEQRVIGYFGAFASWFDYDLVKYVAQQCKEYKFLFIGWEYDNSLSKSDISDLENVTILGPINYTELPIYAAEFDVSIIPFKVNEITESTSPIKLFEYMALGRPVVTTAMPECMLYEPVLIARDREEFVLKLREAIRLQDNAKYLSKLNECALENTWQAKAKDLIKLIQS
ncbi:glycosyltransferase [Niameybacter massiliensis]|uniref:glycosyltransferase n=1 Tax=Niameybacter massiliensis TaxID=1658108 RepID=UPI0006B5EB7B|nr:glycosyltransferase [Niameybacter massiliensis]